MEWDGLEKVGEGAEATGVTPGNTGDTPNDEVFTAPTETAQKQK